MFAAAPFEFHDRLELEAGVQLPGAGEALYGPAIMPADLGQLAAIELDHTRVGQGAEDLVHGAFVAVGADLEHIAKPDVDLFADLAADRRFELEAVVEFERRRRENERSNP